MMKPVDLTKPVQTRCGEKARIICTDRIGGSPVVALISGEDGIENIRFYQSNGRYSPQSELDIDLINVPVEHDGWVNVYECGADESRDFASQVYPSKEVADEHQSVTRQRIACIPIKFTDGQGL